MKGNTTRKETPAKQAPSNKLQPSASSQKQPSGRTSKEQGTNKRKSA